MLVYTLEITLMKIESNQIYCMLSEVTFKKTNIFLGELEQIFGLSI